MIVLNSMLYNEVKRLQDKPLDEFVLLLQCPPGKLLDALHKSYLRYADLVSAAVCVSSSTHCLFLSPSFRRMLSIKLYGQDRLAIVRSFVALSLCSRKENDGPRSMALRRRFFFFLVMRAVDAVASLVSCFPFCVALPIGHD